MFAKFRAGYTLSNDAQAILSIGSDLFRLYNFRLYNETGTVAWAGAKNQQVVAALKNEREGKVIAVSSRGYNASYSFSLIGSSDALAALPVCSASVQAGETVSGVTQPDTEERITGAEIEDVGDAGEAEGVPGTTQADLEERVRKIVVAHFDIDEKQVTTDANFNDLGADSLDTVEVVMLLEEEFGVAMPNDCSILTVGDAVRFIKSVGL